jgi:cation transport ATPase
MYDCYHHERLDSIGNQSNTVHDNSRLLPQQDQKEEFSLLLKGLIKGLESKAKTAVCAAVDGSVVAVYGISDALRPEAPEVRVPTYES